MTTLKISATEPQAEFLGLEDDIKCLVAGFGAGKTQTAIDAAIIDILRFRHVKDGIVALYEPSYDLIELVLVPRIIEKLEELNLPYKYNTSKKRFYITGACDIIMRSLTNPERIVAYQSCSAHIDELDTLKPEKAAEAFTKIAARTRLKLPDGENNKLCVYTTPEGYRFVYETWYKPARKLDKIINMGSYKKASFTKEVGNGKTLSFGMVQASTFSNPFLPDNYVPMLEGVYPEKQLQAYLNGDFVNMTSGTVYYAYDRKKNRSTETIQPGETLFIGCDFNRYRQAASIYVKRNNGEEWHLVEELTKMQGTPQMIDIIKDKWESKGHKIIMYPDATGNRGDTREDPRHGQYSGDLALLSQAGFTVRTKKSNPRQAARILAFNTAAEKAKVFVNDDNCPVSADCLEKQVYDHNDKPVKDGIFDDQNDATTYPIAFEMPIRKPVASIPFSFAV